MGGAAASASSTMQSMKSYLRYEPSIKAGIIAAPSCNIIYDRTGQLVFTGGLDDINVFHLRQAKQIAALHAQASNYPHILAGEVVVLCHSNADNSVIAAGSEHFMFIIHITSDQL